MKINITLEKLQFHVGKFQKPEVISEADLKTWIEVLESFLAKKNQHAF